MSTARCSSSTPQFVQNMTQIFLMHCKDEVNIVRRVLSTVLTGEVSGISGDEGASRPL